MVRQLTPLRVVNTIDPALSLNDNATMLVDVFSTIDTLGLVALDLRLLDGDGAVLAVARVDLESLLVGSDVEADSGGAGVHVDDRDDRVTSCVLRRAIYDEAVVIAGAVIAAESVGFRDVLADEFAGDEVRGAVVDVDVEDGAVGDQDAVCADEALGEW